MTLKKKKIPNSFLSHAFPSTKHTISLYTYSQSLLFLHTSNETACNTL